MIDFIPNKIATYCYLHCIYVGEDKTRLLNVVFNREGTFEVIMYTVDISTMQEYMAQYPKIRYDFRIENNTLYHSTKVAVISKSRESILASANTKEDCCPKTFSIYNLFNDIIVRRGYFVLDQYAEDPSVEYDGTPFTNFSCLNIADSTMSVYMNCIDDKGWFSKSIIKIENGMLRSFPFYFAIPTGEESGFSEYNVRKIREERIGDTNFSIFKFDKSVPIYLHTRDTFRFFPSLIVRYAYNIEFYKTLVTVCKVVLKNLKLNMNVEEPEIKKVKTTRKIAKTDYDKKYTVSFILNDKAPSATVVEDLFNFCLQNYLKDIKSNVQVDMQRIKADTEHMGLNSFGIAAINFILVLLRKYAVVPNDIISFACAYKEYYESRLLKNRMVLYAFRATTYISKFDFNQAFIGLSSEFPIYGSDVNNYVKVRRVLNEQ